MIPDAPAIVDGILEQVEFRQPITAQDATDLRDLLRHTLNESGVDHSIECYHRHTILIVQIWYGPNRASDLKREIAVKPADAP